MSTNNVKQIEELEEGKWVTIEVTFMQEWENDHDTIRQIGLFQDDTGIVKFVSWEKSGLPLLEEGVRYRVGKVPISKYEDYLQIALVKTTIIERLDPIQTELPDESREFEKAERDADNEARKSNQKTGVRRTV